MLLVDDVEDAFVDICLVWWVPTVLRQALWRHTVMLAWPFVYRQQLTLCLQLICRVRVRHALCIVRLIAVNCLSMIIVAICAEGFLASIMLQPLCERWKRALPRFIAIIASLLLIYIEQWFGFAMYFGCKMAEVGLMHPLVRLLDKVVQISRLSHLILVALIWPPNFLVATLRIVNHG